MTKPLRHCETCQCRGVIQRGVPLPGELQDLNRPNLHGEMKHWYTYEQAALLCLRSPLYIKNLVSKHKLHHILVRGPGAKRTNIVLLSAEAVAFLRRKLLGV